MKISTQTFSNFKPFDVVISIENRRDLEAISSLTNAAYNDIAAFLNKNKYHESYADFSCEEDCIKKIQEICAVLATH